MVDRLNEAVWEFLQEKLGVVQKKKKQHQPKTRQRPKVMARLRKKKRELKREWMQMKANSNVDEEEMTRLKKIVESDCACA